MTYEQDQTIRITGKFRNISGALIDPTVVKFRVKPPSGAVTEYVYGTDQVLVRDAEGVYRFDLEFVSAGQWKWKWISTGTGAAAKTTEVTVAAADF